ncbi:transglycosylase domain-containing protein, partial [Candidatus Peregrinibacteria bacterium]|nr:transglycosylase domain-containing protein [Candidatus Peregrinibacteria bacterium]
MAAKKKKKRNRGKKKLQQQKKAVIEVVKKEKVEAPKEEPAFEFDPLKIIGVASSEDLNPEPPKEVKTGKFKIFWGKHSGWMWTIVKILLIIVGGVILLAVLGAIAVFLIWGNDLPDVSKLKSANFDETTTIYDRDGNVLYRIFGEENRTYVPLNKINEKVIDATISIEDKNFYGHFGFDPIGIARAQINNLNDDNTVQGASTITQQLARNLYLSPERSWDRKIKELILAVEIEWYYTKDEILEMYFNKIPYGSNAFGIEAASKTFFNKTSADLTLAEAAVLASLPKGPSKFSPYGNNKKELMGYCKIEVCESPDDGNYVWGRKDLVLERMVEDGKISREEFEEAWRDGFEIKFQDLKQIIKSPHFVFFVRDYLEKKYGQELVESGGLEVRTTLDPLLQANAETVLADHYEKNVKKYGANNAALISLDPKTGGVLAMVGSVNYWDESIDGQVNVTTSLRQPGSTFKPLVYANAIENAGIGSGTVLNDLKTKFENNYIHNNSDNGFKGRMTLRSALAQARNIPAIKAWYLGGGEQKMLEFLGKVGINSLQEYKDRYNSNPERKWDFSYGPAMAIGSGEVRLLDLADAYAMFPNNGRYNPVNPILEIRDRNGEILEKYEDHSVQVIKPETAYIINNVLSDVYARPAGSWRNILTIPGQNIAAKTGTSNKKVGRTNYPNNLVTIGYTPTILSATWVGNSDGKQTSYSAWGEFTAAPINKAFLELALKDKPLVEYDKPEGIIEVGKDFYPPNWDNKKRYDTFKPLSLRDCSDQDRAKDPVGCKSKEQQAKDDAAKAAKETPAESERPLNNNDAKASGSGSTKPAAPST